MIERPSRRAMLKYGTAAAVSAGLGGVLEGQDKKSPLQRTVVIMFDGFGVDYLAESKMPVFGQWKRDGLYKPVKGLMPSVTNINNASICCGVWPEEHGITGNTYFDEKTGVEDYTESPDLLLAPTLFERAARKGVKSALLSSKAKTITFLLRGAEIVLTAENPTPEWVKKIGPTQSIYSREINYWLMAAAIDVLIGQAMHAAPDAAFLVTADHGMNAKTLCWDLERVCERQGVPLRKAFSVGRDRYVKQHRGCSGGAYVYLKNPQDADRVREIISGLKGVEHVIARDQAARDYKLMKSRIGDLVVWGDMATVFGELDIPLFVYNAKNAPSADYFSHNLDLARWLYRA